MRLIVVFVTYTGELGDLVLPILTLKFLSTEIFKTDYILTKDFLH